MKFYNETYYVFKLFSIKDILIFMYIINNQLFIWTVDVLYEIEKAK